MFGTVFIYLFIGWFLWSPWQSISCRIYSAPRGPATVSIHSWCEKIPVEGEYEKSRAFLIYHSHRRPFPLVSLLFPECLHCQDLTNTTSIPCMSNKVAVKIQPCLQPQRSKRTIDLLIGRISCSQWSETPVNIMQHWEHFFLNNWPQLHYFALIIPKNCLNMLRNLPLRASFYWSIKDKYSRANNVKIEYNWVNI